MTLTATSQTQTSTNFISRLLSTLGDSDLTAVCLFFTLGFLASIYFAIHLPDAASLIAQFP